MARDNDTSIDPRDLPQLAEAEWDGLSDPDDLEDTELADQLDDLEDDDVLDEDDDNPYQESDEALPDDKEEAEIARDFDRDPNN